MFRLLAIHLQMAHQHCKGNYHYMIDVDGTSEDGLLRTETCKYNLITLGGVNEVVLIILTSVTDQK
jgi:hypothetical protein